MTFINNQINVVNKGEVSYDIYLRANALYSFAQKEANQEEYSLYPFVNPNDESEKGAHFAETYVNFDENFLTNHVALDPNLTVYSLVNSIVQGGVATKVQILVNGETNVKYHETIDLSQPFSRDLEIIKEEE